MVKRLAIIPARGGSKRIPHKNILPFCGKPMIAWTIEAAKKSGMFDCVFVSTEDPQIAKIAAESGAEVPFLRDSHFDDHSTVSDAVVSGVQKLQDYMSIEFDQVVQLMANCPVRSDQDIVRSIENFEDNKLRFQLSCFQFGWMNPWWAVTLKENGCPQPLHEDALKTRSQDLPPLFCPTGAIWIAQTQALIESKTFYGPDYRFFPIPWTSAVDIDDYHDLDMARSVMGMLHGRIYPN